MKVRPPTTDVQRELVRFVPFEGGLVVECLQCGWRSRTFARREDARTAASIYAEHLKWIHPRGGPRYDDAKP